MESRHWAEDAARTHLEAQGMTCLATNYRLRLGELDLVMREGPTLVFVEVRQRSGTRFGGAAESLDRRKLQRVRRAAQHWAQAHHEARNAAMRIDAVLVHGTRERHRIEHLINVA